ncbi:MAG: hypothetical protein DID92_2727745131 [Candidatus Nitrotoga sp. SPKER]|nr:MAG: hypothetical protein DID92_2727745131 [Candidatus Nitrotoga sp. SPKER]
MAAWKTIPSWFKLENYDDCANFDLFEWVSELRDRWITATAVPGSGYDPEGLFDHAKDKIFDHIKYNGLLGKREPLKYKYPELLRRHESAYQTNQCVVKNLSQQTAYSFFLDADNKEEIEYDYSVLMDCSIASALDRLKERKETSAKLSYPVTNLAYYKNDNRAYLDIDLDASNEQLLMEFKDWLHETKGDTKDTVKRRFSKADFEDWHTSRVLPYWDLTTIAASENATIPFHMLGEALFPGEIGVDNAERVRKVTKKKCLFLFSNSVQIALNVQAEAEEIKRNKS